jgi:hypothetical protein
MTVTKTGTTCKKCNRFVWKEDVGEAGLCCFCKPTSEFQPKPVYGMPKVTRIVRRKKAEKDKE